MKSIVTGQSFILNYQRFQNNRVNLYEYFFLGTQVQTKIRNFELTRFYWYRFIYV
jgi:hypothetical protein